MDSDTAHMMAASKVPMLKPDSNSEMLDQTFDRLQKLRTKEDIDTMSMDDLYNNLKVYEPEVKGISSSSTNTQNMAFMSLSSNNSTNGAINTAQAVNTTIGVSTAGTQVNTANIDNLSDAVICAFLASQPSSSQHVNKDLEQIHLDDLKEMDLKWQMAMLFLKKTRRKLTVNGNETIRFDKTNVECYNCHKRGHFARECRAPRNQDTKYKESTRRTVPMETSASTTLVSCDGLGGYDWSDQDEEGLNYALMAYTSISSDLKIVDNCKKGLGYENYNAVRPPYTGNFMPPKPDLSFTGLDEFTNKLVVKNSEAESSQAKHKEVRKNTDTLIIKEWVSDDEDEGMIQPKFEQEIVKTSIAKIKIVLSIEDKLNYLDQPIPPASVVPDGVKNSVCSTSRAGASSDYARISFLQARKKAEFDGFVQNYNMHSMRKTINELHAMLKLHGGQNQRKWKTKLTYAPKPKIPPPPKRKDHAKDSVCHECRDTCHWKRNCPQYLAELQKNKKLSQGASDLGIFIIELYTFLNKSWVYDTGCGTHICNTTQCPRGSRKLKSGALSLYVGNGQRVAVEAIGSYHLSLLSELVIVLNNFHYSPSITRGIISVSSLYDDGYVNQFVDNSIQISRNNMVYFSAVPRDGIFEIDLSDSYSNVSSIYTLSNKRAKSNLGSTLLWHCHLGHISKKRIEKLQHDGLLNSIKLRAFSKCIPCMSGKMARKPYSHQVERAKDLLGLIHTDVCGPFKIVSRQGASYFVTFTDDFSRYGYVYLLKHKHEVFETFKVFQKEVENQLGYTKETIGYSFYYLPENKVLVARNVEFLKNSLITQEASGSLEDLEIIQEKDTHPSIDTSLNHEEDDLETDELQSDIIPIRSKWLFKKKTDMDGAVHTYKARVVAKGYTQTLRIDYKETFYRIADIRAIRILIAMAAFYDYDIWQMDVKTAFLNGYPFKEVYMEQPEGFVNPKYLNQGNNILMLQHVKSYLGRCFAMKDLGEAAYILGIKIYRDRSRHLIEAEYIAAFDASKEAVWVRKFISGLGVVPTIEEPINMYYDNTGAITIANESGITKGARHFRAKVHYLRKVNGDVKLEKLHTDDNLADPFTKALAFPKHLEHTKNI
nr:hypothetical protein [Tanacetum cinerariifolium]